MVGKITHAGGERKRKKKDRKEEKRTTAERETKAAVDQLNASYANMCRVRLGQVLWSLELGSEHDNQDASWSLLLLLLLLLLSSLPVIMLYGFIIGVDLCEQIRSLSYSRFWTCFNQEPG